MNAVFSFFFFFSGFCFKMKESHGFYEVWLRRREDRSAICFYETRCIPRFDTQDSQFERSLITSILYLITRQ